MNVISVKNLRKDIVNGDNKIEVLNNINLTIKEKEYIAIMGRSGSGKSTLLGILAGLDDITEGEVLIVGTDITKLTENDMSIFRNENIGIVFQTFNLIPILTALENIEMPLYFSKKNINMRKRAKELLKMVGLEEKANIFPKQLSGGEQQRIAIARALITEPKILFADEPTGALDSKNGENVLNIIKKFREEYGTTIVMITHDQKVASEADKILLLSDGNLKQVNER